MNTVGLMTSVPPPGPVHVAADVGEARALHELVREQGREGAAGIVQGERALSRIEHTHPDETQPKAPPETEA